MRKVFYISFALILAALLTVIAVLTNLSAIASYAIGKAIEGRVEISNSYLTFKKGIFSADFNNIQLKGNIEGRIGNCQLNIGLKKGFYVRDLLLSDFDLRITVKEGKSLHLPLPENIIEAKNGIIVHNNEKFYFDKIKVKGLSPEKNFIFEVTVRNDNFFRKLKALGGGLYSGKNSRIKGQLNIEGLNLHNVSENMGGNADVKGPFSYVKENFSFEGPFEILDYSLKDLIFKKLFVVEKSRGNLSFMYSDNAMEIKISHADYKGVPLNLNLEFTKKLLTKLELAMEFFPVSYVKELISLNTILKVNFDIWNFIDGGKVKVNKFVYSTNHPLCMELKLKEAGIFYKDFNFNDVETELFFKENKLDIKNARGFFRTSSIYDVRGFISFQNDMAIRLTGKYFFSLEDVASFINTGNIILRNGQAEGVIDLSGNKNEGLNIKGSGKLIRADVMWNKFSSIGNGFFKFNNDEIIFDPIILKRGFTDILIIGKWQKNLLGLQIKGNLDAIDIKPFLPGIYGLEGIAGVDIDIQKFDNNVKVDGNVSMDDIYFEYQDIIKKERGLKSRATLTFLKENENISIDRFLYNLDIINLDLKGKIKPDRKMDFDFEIDIADFGRIAPLLFFDNYSAQGNLNARMSLTDMEFPLKNIPYMEGYIKVNNGAMRLPWLKETIREIDLVSDFQGKTFDIRVNKLTCGRTVLKQASLFSENIVQPHFLFNIDLDALDLASFQRKGDFKINVIDRSSLIAKMKGDINLLAKKIYFSNFTGDNFEAEGSFGDSRLNISQFKMDVFGGRANLYSSIDLSGDVPHVFVSNRLEKIQNRLFLKIFDERIYVKEGISSIYSNTDLYGSTVKELFGNMDGDVRIYSRDGLITKWNFLSNLLGLLNIQDVLRGKADLLKKGLPYKKMGATFTGKNGIFFTKDFIIDSPSMLIAGEGSINIKNSYIDANVTVSPLVAVDRIIGKIPVIRNILRSNREGFLYMGYTVKGPINDPDVRFNYKKSVGGKTINTLRNVLELPKEIFEND